MSLVTLPGGVMLNFSPWPLDGNPVLATTTLDAVGESLSVIGQVVLSTGPGTTKTLSAAGSGKVVWLPGSIAGFATASTAVRIGVQDVSAGVEDGTYDVYADIVQGTDTITANAMNAVTMESGTKDIAYGQTIAITIEMTVRNGSDAVIVQRDGSTTAGDHPVAYLTIDSGAGPALTSGTGIAAIVFDDGTVGWITGLPPAFQTSEAINTGTTPDEIALIFQPTFKTRIIGIIAQLDNIATTDTLEAVFYTTPLGTPVAAHTQTVDPTLMASTTSDGLARFFFNATYDLTPGTDYAVAIRPTSANSITVYELAFGTGLSALRATTPLGTGQSYGNRVNQTGAFTNTSTILLPCIGPIFGAFDDGASAGGGGVPVIGGSIVRVI